MEKNNNQTYSIPIYEDGVKTEYTIDGVYGDEKYLYMLSIYKELPLIVNVNLKK